ncbi:MAG: sigma-70 family RNA polymerase sigma factor [Candidatus Firestonebacteria bacterium]
MEDISNEILIKCRKNDVESYRRVIQYYRGFIFSVIYRFLGGKYSEEVESFAREIFIRLYGFIKKYDADKGIKFSVCVFTIVRNYCFNELRIKRLQLDPAEKNIFPAREDSESEALAGELKQRVEKCIETLPDDQRMILILREYEGFSYEEISELMNVPSGIVKSKINRAKIKLKDLLWPYLKEDHGKTV